MFFTYVARVADGVMLVASIDTNSNNNSLEQYKSDGKRILQELGSHSPLQCTVEAENYNFHYIIEGSVAYLTLTSSSFPKRSVFLYLSQLHKSFSRYLELQYGAKWENEIATVDRPYAFIKFDREIQQIRKQHSDGRSDKDMNKINSELFEVQSIMKKNIEDVLGRGDRLQKAAETSSNLVHESKRFSSKAKTLNWLHLYKTYGPLVGITFLVVCLLYYRFFW